MATPPAAQGAVLLLLTEDSADEADATFKHIARKSCRLVVPTCQTHRIDMRPANDNERAALRGNAWKERKKQEPGRHAAYVRLLQSIATHVCTPRGFVLFHFDGDRAWAKRKTSENVAAFQDLVVDRVRQQIVQRNEKIRRKQLAGNEVDVEACVARLIPIVPFYSIESWLYQNTERAIEICERAYAGRDVVQFTAWAGDRGLVDEVPQIKSAVCLGAEHNHELASTLDAAVVESIGKSYAAAVQRLRAQPAFMAALHGVADVPSPA